jgi:ribosomal protein L7/L12
MATSPLLLILGAGVAFLVVIVFVVVLLVALDKKNAPIAQEDPPRPAAVPAKGGDYLAVVRDLMRKGNKIEAIKVYREATGLGLAESKSAVEAMHFHEPVAPVATAAPASSASMAQVEELVRQGQLINAIKVYRELTGLGLKESKDAVDALSRGERVSHPAPVAPAAPASMAQVEELLRQGQLIQAIKVHRELTGMGLKESKDAVEAMRERMKLG